MQGGRVTGRQIAIYAPTAAVAAIGFARAFWRRAPADPIAILWSGAAVLIVTGVTYALLRHLLLGNQAPAQPATDDLAGQCSRVACDVEAMVERLKVKTSELEQGGQYRAAELARFDSGQLQSIADRMRGLSRRLREPAEGEPENAPGR